MARMEKIAAPAVLRIADESSPLTLRAPLAADGRALFAFDTTRPGNGNAGHEGAAYGTSLSDSDKWALLEYLKTF